MSTKLALLTLVGAGTIAAAGAGGYIALRQNAGNAVPPQAAAEATNLSTAIVEPTPEVQPQTAEAPEIKEPAHAAPKSARPAPAARVLKPKAPVVANVPASAPAPQTSQAPSVSEPIRIIEPRDAAAEPAPAPAYEPARPRFEELTIPPDAVIGIRLESTVSSENARVEDKVTARVSRDVTVEGQTAISSGTRLEGVVTSVERGGKFKDRARVGLRFESLVLADGTRVPVETETIFREGESPTGPAATKVGASAAIGGILGAVLGGKKGAAIGAAVGAAGGSGAVMAGSGAAAAITSGTPLTVRLTAPVTVRIQREN